MLLFGLGPRPASAQDEAVFVDRTAVSETPILSTESILGPIEYRPGRGLSFSEYGFNIGGFSILNFEQEEGDAGLIEWEGANFLMLFEPVAWFRVFGEVEVGNALVIDLGSGDNESDLELETERIYGEVSISDPLVLRLGKFRTPIGRWNLVRSEAFHWTNHEPVITEVSFEDSQSGGMVRGTVYPSDDTLTYSIYSGFFDPIDTDSDERYGAHDSLGGRLEYAESFGGWSVAASLLGEERKGDWRLVTAIDGRVQLGALELTAEYLYSEAGYRSPRMDPPEAFGAPEGDEDDFEDEGEMEGLEEPEEDDEGPELGTQDLWGAYLQAVYEVVPTVYAVGRYEHITPSGPLRDINIVDLGAGWMPTPYLFLKADYRLVDHPTEDIARGFRASIALIF